MSAEKKAILTHEEIVRVADRELKTRILAARPLPRIGIRVGRKRTGTRRER